MKHDLLKRAAILGAIFFSALVWSTETEHFRQYQYPADGFEVAFPQKPLEFQTNRGPGRGVVNSYQTLVINPFSQLSVFVSNSPKRVFEDASIDAYLKGSVQGLIKGSDAPVLKYTKRTKFLSFPATEYQYSFNLEGTPVIGHGIFFIADGDHIRLSQIYAKTNRNAEKEFKKFVGSFRLTPIEGDLSKQRFDDPTRDISFSPPDKWQQGSSKFSQVVTLFKNPGGHSITVIDSGTPAYECNNYKHEMLSTQGGQDTGEISTRGRTVTWLKSTAPHPSYGVRIKSIHYCVNTITGAVIMIGAAPEQTFFRSENIFRKVATSLVVRK